MTRLVDRIHRSVKIRRDTDGGAQRMLDSEWLVTNGLGGYSSGTVAGVNTRRYHGLLVAALENPLGRTVMLNHLGERVRLGDAPPIHLAGEERTAGRADPDGAKRLASFALDAGLPVWSYEFDGVRLEKRILMPYRQNTVHISYRIIEAPEGAKLDLHPLVHFRGYEAPVNAPLEGVCRWSSVAGRYEITAEDTRWPPLLLSLLGVDASFVADAKVASEFLYPVEQTRGYEFRGALWSPGRLAIDIAPGTAFTLVASTESPAVMDALAPGEAQEAERERRRRLVTMAVPAAREPVAAELVLAADQFIFTPVGRVVDTARAQAVGDEIRSVIAGYHWFTDWGRDTMISLEGLTMVTGRWREAGYILRTFAHYVRDGLLPNMFPDGSNEGLYHTADATLWFFHAVERYVRISGDETTLLHLLPTMESIVDHHLKGTRFGICVDPADGLLRQGAEGYQLTWMDAKVDGWVVTPRRGKAVEINALWYNALCLLGGWLERVRGAGAANVVRQHAARARESFNRRFWSEELGYLYDVVDGEHGDSPHCRPNQVFAISLDNPVLDRERWVPVLDTVRARLLTPVGLRSLAPGDPDYKAKYYGDLRTRDAAYHQGTVWGWLIGPFVDAWLRVHPDDQAGARKLLDGLIAHLDDFGVGSIAEIFDAEPPYTPRGCIAQAWSVAEVLRCWVKTADESEAEG